MAKHVANLVDLVDLTEVSDTNTKMHQPKLMDISNCLINKNTDGKRTIGMMNR